MELRNLSFATVGEWETRDPSSRSWCSGWQLADAQNGFHKDESARLSGRARRSNDAI